MSFEGVVKSICSTSRLCAEDRTTYNIFFICILSVMPKDIYVPHLDYNLLFVAYILNPSSLLEIRLYSATAVSIHTSVYRFIILLSYKQPTISYVGRNSSTRKIVSDFPSEYFAAWDPMPVSTNKKRMGKNVILVGSVFVFVRLQVSKQFSRISFCCYIDSSLSRIANLCR
ncbi:unnamed protein product [Albugo candida]|uniref:Uncharacterized protein n=1 Tax=Albugo candida TaxID=65357 RepID=A0A024FWK9_9STRA|nr:unnamed protein product [Albugo candida]|eukprot:CCI11322.1 unnamed protein product [Albugo candida]